VVRERIKEIADFATSESPYRNANKGWVNDDVYIQFGTSTDHPNQSRDELLDILVFWEPIKKLISILFFVLLLASFLVFTTVSFSRGRIDISWMIEQSFQNLNPSKQANQFELIQEETSESIIEEKDIEVLSNEQNNEIKPEIISNEPETTSLDSLKPSENALNPETKKAMGTAGNLF
tara:strand:- start:36 stop:569 length:534 start_codon:yes stop_codon:yes gene_type:complete